MNWKSVITNDVISQYIIFGAGLLAGLLAHFVPKLFRRPAVVRIEKQKDITLINLNPDARGRLKVTYEDRPIDDFHLTTFDLTNRTGTTLDHVALRLYLDQAKGRQSLYEISVEDPMGEMRNPAASARCVVEESGEHYLLVSAPFLNDFKKDKDRVVIKVYTPEPIRVERLVGGGRGWMGKYFDRVAFNERLDRMVRESSSPFEMVVNSMVVGLFRRWK